MQNRLELQVWNKRRKGGGGGLCFMEGILNYSSSGFQALIYNLPFGLVIFTPPLEFSTLRPLG